MNCQQVLVISFGYTSIRYMNFGLLDPVKRKYSSLKKKKNFQNSILLSKLKYRMMLILEIHLCKFSSRELSLNKNTFIYSLSILNTFLKMCETYYFQLNKMA